MFKRSKISIIGAGFTGTTTAFMLSQKGFSDIVLVDIPSMEKPTQGKALDIQETTPLTGSHSHITGTSNYIDTKDSDIVIITAGIARKPGMSRDELIGINSNIIKNITKEVVKYSPLAIIIVLTNPVDVLTYVVLKESGFQNHRVIGQSGVLDTARFRTFISEELNVSVRDITGFVLGGHGDSMVPLVRYSYAGGIPLEKLITKERLDQIVSRTRNGGGEIVSLLGNGSAYYAPAASLCEMVEAIVFDERRILPSVAYLNGEYGYHDLCLGVPTILGGNGLEKIIELELNQEEKDALDVSASDVKKLIDSLKDVNN